MSEQQFHRIEGTDLQVSAMLVEPGKMHSKHIRRLYGTPNTVFLHLEWRWGDTGHVQRNVLTMLRMGAVATASLATEVKWQSGASRRVRRLLIDAELSRLHLEIVFRHVQSDAGHRIRFQLDGNDLVLASSASAGGVGMMLQRMLERLQVA